ncbi:hypothetical protein LINGRAHAP2_LOCUS29511 [Linum grandiflorum]
MEKKSSMQLAFIIVALLVILAAGWENTKVEGEHYTFRARSGVRWVTTSVITRINVFAMETENH